jgi:cysteine desulfurase
MKRIYLDHAATTYLDPEVKAAMEPYWQNVFGNASSIYKEGIEARNAMNAARKKIASLIGANPDEIIFTNGGTESDNIAIFGVARNFSPRGQTSGNSPRFDLKRIPHIITSKIEHHAVLNSCEVLAREGFKVTCLNVNKDGIVDLKELKKSLKKDTILVSIMYVNNEIGIIQPIREIAKIIRDFRKRNNSQNPFFHTDAIQAAGYLDLNVQKLGVDLMSVNASKIYGPKGIGFSYIRRRVKLSPILYGGSQERGLRPGTENIPEIVGLAKALEISQGMREKESRRLITLRDYLIKSILKKIPRSSLNGHPILRLPNNVNMTISGVEGESLILYLDAAGISCSTGSACTSSSLEPSHVIVALGKSKEDAHCSVRFTLGRKTKKRDMDYLLKILPDIVKKLRKTSAL